MSFAIIVGVVVIGRLVSEALEYRHKEKMAGLKSPPKSE